MVKKIRDTEVAGIVTSSGKCPSCKNRLGSQEEDYIYVKKNRGVALHKNGEDYVKCNFCGKFVMVPRMAA